MTQWVVMTLSLIAFSLVLCLLKIFVWLLERSERNKRRTRIILSRQFTIQRPISIQIRTDYESFEGRAMLMKCGPSSAPNRGCGERGCGERGCGERGYGSVDQSLTSLTTSKDDADVKCVICLEHFRENEELVVLTCNHVFHEPCIMKWLDEASVCPVCRAFISESDFELIIETISPSYTRCAEVTSV
eukprot:gene15347-16922_t